MPLIVTWFLLVGLLTAVGQRPAAAVIIDGAPVIGLDPPVPQSHAPAGGSAVRIYGEGLLGVNSVTIGGVALAATDFKVVDSDLIIATVPAAGVGVVNAGNDGFAHITVSDDEGSSTTDLDGDGAVDDQKCESCVGGELGAIFYTDATLTLGTSTNLDSGETSLMTLDGHLPGTRGAWALTELNPLVNFLEDAPADPDTMPVGPAYGHVFNLLTPDANGDLAETVTVKSRTSSPQFNDKDQDYDPDADCPVSQTTANYGLDKCMLGYSQFGMASIEKLFSFGTDGADVDPTPAAPTLTVTLSSTATGSTVYLSGTNWNAAPHFGSDTAQDDPGESALLIDLCDSLGNNCTSVSSPAATVTPTRYFDSGTDPDTQPVTGVFSGATLSGSFTVPSCTSPNCAVVKVRQQRYDIDTNAPVAATYLSATTAFSAASANLSIDDVAVTEGNSGSATATFTVTRTGLVSGASSVTYATSNGTATSGSDYTAVGATVLNFAANETSKSAAITVTGDTSHEPDQTFTVNLTLASGATIIRSPGTGTIRDDDGPSYLSINDITVAEGNTGTVATFNVSRDGNTSLTSTVNYVTANGTATSGSDYTAVGSTTLTFLPGQSTKAVAVNVTGDTVVDSSSSETFTVTLSSPSAGTTLSDTSGIATIVDNDAASTWTIDDLVVTEGNAGTSLATFTVKRWGASGAAASVTYTTSDGTATTADSDYTAAGPTVLNFAANDTSKTFTVSITGDTTDTGNETFNVTLSSPSIGTTLADTVAIATIKNDDGAVVAVPPSFSVNDVSVVEGHAGSVTANFTVTRSGDTSAANSVSYATANGTATTLHFDYTQIAATVLNFAIGETTKTVAVTVLSDMIYETTGANENFFLNLSSPSGGATLGDAQGQATIFNDDWGYFSISDVALHEGNAGTTTAQFIVTRSGAIQGAGSVKYKTVASTAVSPSDYTAVSSTTLSFTGEETSKLVSITINGDTSNEGDQAFFVDLEIPAAGHTISDNRGIGTIVNDDP